MNASREQQRDPLSAELEEADAALGQAIDEFRAHNERDEMPYEAWRIESLRLHEQMSKAQARHRDVVEKMQDAEVKGIDRDTSYAAVGLLNQQIEALGSSPEITACSSLAVAICGAIGNRWNPPRSYAIEEVRRALKDGGAQ